ncbi:MAG: DNA topoisomerase IV [Anditalea sp.]
MYSRFAKVFYFLSILFFIAGFLYIYAGLPEKVSYEVNETGYPIKQISRDAFFFIAIAAFVVLNLLVIVPAKLVENQFISRVRKLLVVGDPFRDQMLAWIYSFIGIINISLFIMAFYILRINSLNGMDSGGIDLIFYSVPLFFMVWIVTLFVILGKKIKQIQSA